ncbi:MAG: XdhC family protein [Bacteroidetes bacterium]|nr:XdhC family protein [Bacteroidota bacterium]
MKDLLLRLHEFEQTGKAFVLCILTESSGSTPRKAGAKMLVFADSSSQGTIGGGAIEMQVKKDALEIMQAGGATKRKYILEEDVQMRCGGAIEVYFEPFGPPLPLIIFGAGHVGREVGTLAASYGFSITYIDHRPEIFNEFDASQANCVTGDYLVQAGKFTENTRAFIVICTPEHHWDEGLVALLARHPFAYVGMMGSKRKVAEIRQRLLSSNTLSSELIDKVDMPIGIPMHAETPREIALSIVARLVDVKNNRSL